MKGWLYSSPEPRAPALKRWGWHSRWQFHSPIHLGTLTGIGGGLHWLELSGHGETHFSRDSKGAGVDG